MASWRSTRWICVATLATLAPIACAEEEPPRPATSSLQPGMLDPLDEPSLTPTPQGPTLASPDGLKTALPRLTRGSRYDWGHHSALVPGHLASQLMEADEAKDKPPRHVMTFIIDDLLARPQRLTQMQAMPPVINKRPGEIIQAEYIRVLVDDRFEVVVRAEDPSHANYEKLKYWHDQMRLSEIKKALDAPTEP